MEPTHKISKTKLTKGCYRLIFPLLRQEEGSISGGERSSESEGERLEPSDETKSPDYSSPTSGVRLSLAPINNSVVQREIHLIEQYLRDSGVIANIQNFTTLLLNTAILPYNPYPGFIRRCRQLSERFQMFKKPISDIRLNLDKVTYKVGTGILHGLKGGQGNIWGLEHIVSHVNPKFLEPFLSVVPLITISNEIATAKCRQKVSLLISLSGPCVFSGSFYPIWNNIELKVAVLLASNDLVTASKVFLEFLVADLNHMKKQDTCILLGIEVPLESQVGWTNQTFPRINILKILENYNTGESKFKQLVLHAIVSKKRITVNFLLVRKGNQVLSKYTPASKMYNLMMIQSGSFNQNLPNRKLKQPLHQLVISTLPFQALHEGIFYDRQQADDYILSFHKYYASGLGGKQGTIDPMTSDKLQPIIQAWQMKVANSVLVHAPFPTIHYTLLLYLAQSRTKSFAKHAEEDLAIEVCRFSRGSATKLKNILFFTEVVKQMLTVEEDKLETYTNEIIYHARKLLLDFVEENFEDVSSEILSLKHLVTTTCVTSNQNDLSSVQCFQELNDYILFLIYGLSANALEKCAAILLLKTRLEATYPHLQYQKKFADKQSPYPHGIKNSNWTEIDTLKIDKQFVTLNSQAPKSISPHFTLMQYSADCRLDETWIDFLKTLLLFENGLPPNPYPVLIFILKKGNTRMQCFFESDRISSIRLLQDKIVNVEQLRNICNIPGTMAFGTRASLMLVNLLGFRQSYELASKVIPVPPGSTVTGGPLLSGSFQITICPGISPPVTYYGSLNSFMSFLSLNEYYFINGPAGHHQPGAVALSKLILSHLINLKKEGVILHQALFGGIVLYLRNLVLAPARFESEFSAAITGSQLVQLSFFYPLKWRYILIKKKLLIHFIDEENGKLTPMYRDISLSENPKMSIFLHAEDANHCCNTMKISTPTNTQKDKITELWKSMQWPQLVEHLICDIVSKRSSKRPETETYLEAILAFSWRYYSSIPGQIYYLMELNKALQGILRNASSAVEENLSVNSVINPALVETFLIQYRTKLNEVLERGSCLAPIGLADYLQEKLNVVAFRNPQNNEFYVKYDKESIQILSDTNGFIKGIHNSSASELFKSSPNVLKYINDGLS